jgi:hypothetical protein
MNHFEASGVEGKGEWIVLNHVEWNVSTQSREGLHGYSAHGKKFLENENKEASGKAGHVWDLSSISPYDISTIYPSSFTAGVAIWNKASNLWIDF